MRTREDFAAGARFILIDQNGNEHNGLRGTLLRQCGGHGSTLWYVEWDGNLEEGIGHIVAEEYMLQEEQFERIADILWDMFEKRREKEEREQEERDYDYRKEMDAGEDW